MPQVELNGFRMFYEEGGVGDALVFVHGGIASLARSLKDPDKYRWGALDHFFADRFRYVSYDRRGCRLSSCPDDGYALENQAADLRSLLEHLQIQRAHIVASSAGGPIAIVFAAQHPERVRSVVLAGTGLSLFPRGDPPSDIVRAQIALLDAAGAEAAFNARPAGVEASLDVLWGAEEASANGRLEEWRAEQDEYARRAASLPYGTRVRRYAAELRSARAYVECDVRTYAARVRAPTLVLHGTDDREVYFPWGTELAETLPHATFISYEGGHHSLLYYSHEARLAALEFLRAH